MENEKKGMLMDVFVIVGCMLAIAAIKAGVSMFL